MLQIQVVPIKNRKPSRSLRILYPILASILWGCGSGNSEQSSTVATSLSSTAASSSVAAAATSYDSALDWDWTQAAKRYCADHQVEPVVPGQFQVLRPEQSRYLHSSEHFVLRWNDGDGVSISQATIDTALQTFERVWDFYINQLHFPEPYGDSATKYKVSVNVSNQGYASGAGTGQRDPEMWVHFDALGHIGTLAHEFAHTLQFTTRSMRDSQYVGWLWESHAQWMAYQFNPQDVQCSEALVNAPHIYYGSTRNRYCNWQFFEFVKDNSCPVFVNDALWQNGIKPEDPSHWTADPFTTLATNATWSTAELNDIFADWALHNVHWDYRDNGAIFKQRYGASDDTSGSRRYRVTRLLPTSVAQQYQVPHYWAPQRWGYNLVELIPEAGRDYLTVEFSGLNQDTPGISSFAPGYRLQPETPAQPNSSWRWSVVVTQGDGKPRYSELQRGETGQLRVELRPGDRAVWLVVMATPEQIQQIFWDQIYYSIYRYPWRITLENARPAQFQDELQPQAGSTHNNGGGWVAATAQVSSSVYVAPNAQVLDRAQVTGNARIEGFAIVRGNAKVSGDALVADYALVAGSGVVKDSARVGGHAAVIGGTVQQQGLVGALSLIDGGSTIIGGNAVVMATMNSINGRQVTGTAQLIGDIELNTSVDRGVFYGIIDAAISADAAYGANRSAAAAEVTRLAD